MIPNQNREIRVEGLRQQWKSKLEQHRAIAVIRTDNYQTGVKALLAAAGGGMRLLEVTWNSDRPDKIITTLRQRVPHCTIGVGTLRSPQDAERAIAAGAQFCFSPHVSPDIVEVAIAHNCPVIPGALSPTEIIAAWETGASAVKVFPAGDMGGSHYIKSLSPVVPDIPLVPSGGVTLENCSAFIQAGAIAVGLSRDLFPQAKLETQDWGGITRCAAKLVRGVAPDTPLKVITLKNPVFRRVLASGNRLFDVFFPFTGLALTADIAPNLRGSFGSVRYGDRNLIQPLLQVANSKDAIVASLR